MKPPLPTEGSFRDRVATVDEDGRRVWIYPRQPRGKFYRARTLVSVLLFAFFFLGPFLKINGRPLLLFNVLEQKFLIFGVGFWPQDFHLFALSLIAFIVFIVLFTVVFGRLFCGWICPQTVFMEMLFRKIEYLIEGDSHKQRHLNRSPWNFEKIRKKASKHGLFYAFSFLIGNTFLAYVIGIEDLKKIVTEPVSQHAAGLAMMMTFSFIFYGTFAYFREQVCVMICPYGRLQGVLLDPNSSAVSYDFKRGEPRAVPKKMAPAPVVGDCVDCKLCVEVCPTGIDIRNGTQLECVNCTACIDACDAVMRKHKRPEGLIRYSSYNGIVNGKGRPLNFRVAGYGAVLSLLLTVIAYLMTNRVPIETTVMRTPGTLYRTTGDGRVQNIFNVTVVNKSFEARRIDFKVKNFPDADLKLATGAKLELASDAVAESVLFVTLPSAALRQSSETLIIDVYSDGRWMESFATKFKTPISPI